MLVSLTEISIGRDLDSIRFNGSLIGKLAGIAFCTTKFLLRLFELLHHNNGFSPQYLLSQDRRGA
jgi:hypothetical protein